LRDRVRPLKEYPYWWDTVPQGEDGASSRKWEVRNQKSEVRSQKYDVAVVGAGYTGLAAARVMAQAGATVIVLDREQVGWGASSRNGGQVLTGLRLDPHRLLSRYGERRARTLFDASLDAIRRVEALIAAESIDCGYERTGHVQAAAKPSHFEGFREEQQLLGRVFDHQVELVPRKDQRSELGTDRYFGLLRDERSGAVNPARYVMGLADAATRAGATIATGLGVHRIVKDGPGWTVHLEGSDRQRPPERIEAEDVLVATNGYTNGAAPALQRRFVPIGSYIIATEPIDDGLLQSLIPQRRMAFDSKHFLHYFRRSADRRLLFGGRAEFSVPSAATTRHAADVLRRGMIEVFPELTNTPIEYAWSGRVAFTRDELPHAGRLDNGVYYAGGYCGHGVALATVLGELIGCRIAGQLVEHPLMDDHFAAIPLYHGRPWFLPLVGAYYRFLDYVV
jgi:glycine/D-amino acid oxidase-like deaminating enzyme